MTIKIGDTISYKTLEGKVINVFDTLTGKILEVSCKTPSEDMDTLLWVPESDVEKQDA